MKAPLTALITFSIDVEPFIDSVPLSSSVAEADASADDASLADVPAAEDVPAVLLVALSEQPVAVATNATPAISDINFLFMLLSFLKGHTPRSFPDTP